MNWTPENLFQNGATGMWFDYGDESTHVVVEGQVFARCKAGSGHLSGPIVRDSATGRMVRDGGESIPRAPTA